MWCPRTLFTPEGSLRRWGCSTTSDFKENPQVRLHPNAKLTPWARHRLAQRVRKQGWPLARAAREAGVSRPTAYKWLNRFDSEGQVGLQDRSSRPHRIPKRTPLKAIRRMERLRRRRKTAWEIALETGIPASTVSSAWRANSCSPAFGGHPASIVPAAYSSVPKTGQNRRTSRPHLALRGLRGTTWHKSAPYMYAYMRVRRTSGIATSCHPAQLPREDRARPPGRRATVAARGR